MSDVNLLVSALVLTAHILEVLVLPFINGEVVLYRFLELWQEVLVGHQHDVVDMGQEQR